MYAIVESGGKQYKVEKGESLLLDRLPAEQGDKVDLRAVMFRDSDVVADPAELEKIKVEATVTEHLRGPKIRIFKYKAKKGYRRRAGHRSELTRVEITDLRQLSRKPAARKTESKSSGGTAKAGAAKTATARKPAAKKGAAKTSSRSGSTRKSSGSSTTGKGGSSGS